MNRNRNQGHKFPTGNPQRSWQDFDETRGRQNFSDGGDPFRGQHSAGHGRGSFGRFGESYGNSVYNSGHQRNQGHGNWPRNWNAGYAAGNRDEITGGNEFSPRARSAQEMHPGRFYGYGEASYPKGGGRNYGGMNADYPEAGQYENYGYDDKYEGGYGAGTGTGQYMGGTQGFGHRDFEDYGTSRAGRNYGGMYDNAYNYESGARDYEGDMGGDWREGGNYGGGYGGGTRGGGPYGQGGFGSRGASYSGRGRAENYNSFRNLGTGDYEDSNWEWRERGRNRDNKRRRED